MAQIIYRNNIINAVGINGGGEGNKDVIDYIEGKVTTLKIPQGTTIIAPYVFRNLWSLKGVEFPNTLLSVDTHSFEGCSGLTSVNFNNAQPTLIASYAFSGCTSLTSFTIPDSVVNVNNNAFNGCTSLTSVTLGNSMSTVNNSVFINCSGLTSVDFKESQPTTIATSAFTNCYSLSTITIPDSVTAINPYAFTNCSGLTSVKLPNTLATIATSTFQNCKGLLKIEIPDSVTAINGYSFSGCSSLAYMNFGNTRTTVPSLSSVNNLANTNNCPIIVPDALYDTWKAATNWKSTTNNIVTRLKKYSDAVAEGIIS